MNLLMIAIAGVIGTTAMVLSMELIHWMGWAKADMIRAVGSLFVRSREGSLGTGLVIHYTMGIAFAFLYAALIGAAPVRTAGAIVVLALAAGLVHGIVVGLLLVIAVAEHHPLEEYRRTSFGVVIAHVAGHVCYGAFLGASLAIMKVNLAFLQEGLSGSPVGEALGFGALWLAMFGIPLSFAAYLVCVAWMERSRGSNEVAHEEADHSKAA